MQAIYNLKISAKLLLCSTTILMLLGIVAVVSIIGQLNTQNAMNTLINRNVLKTQQGYDLGGLVRSADDNGAWALLDPHPEDTNKQMALYNQDVQNITAKLAEIRAMGMSSTELLNQMVFDLNDIIRTFRLNGEIDNLHAKGIKPTRRQSDYDSQHGSRSGRKLDPKVA
jgi:phosphoglycerate-specific signal transduction histidine kinase